MECSLRSHYLYHSFIIVLFYIFLMNDWMECSQVPSSDEMHFFDKRRLSINMKNSSVCWNFMVTLIEMSLYSLTAIFTGADSEVQKLWLIYYSCDSEQFISPPLWRPLSSVPCYFLVSVTTSAPCSLFVLPLLWCSYVDLIFVQLFNQSGFFQDPFIFL